MRSVLFVVLISAVALLAACGTKDGSTTCGDWLNMDSGDQHTAVQNMLQDKGQNANSETTYLTTLGSVKLFCALHPSSDTIDQIYQG
ncbi:MAG TPA: hypothetical protein VHX38_21560 [Pseudonocardiaceae bacterium]|jgi:hypothetical protein|nr:hypothetical protein [Pseudonocardiaceae bacterium]